MKRRDARDARAGKRPGDFITEAVERWGTSVYRLALGVTGSKTEAEDVFQEVFLGLVTTRTQFNDDEHLHAWLVRVTLHKCRDYQRTLFRRTSVSSSAVDFDELPDDSAPGCFMRTELEERDLAVWKAVSSLKPKLREVVVLRYWEELSCEQIAGCLRINPSSVRSRLQRARQRLSASLREDWR